MELVQDEKTGLYHRQGTTDLDAAKSCFVYRKLGLEEGDRVIDIGAGIGGFVKLAVDSGCSAVVAYEPDPDTFQVLERNWASSSVVTLKRSAVILRGMEQPFVLYRKSTTKNVDFDANSFVQKRGREPLEVPGVVFGDVLANVSGVTAVKIAIGGGEHLLPFNVLPNSVKKLAVRIYLTKKEWREVGVVELCKQISDLGFQPIKAPVVDKKNWRTIGIWGR